LEVVPDAAVLPERPEPQQHLAQRDCLRQVRYTKRRVLLLDPTLGFIAVDQPGSILLNEILEEQRTLNVLVLAVFKEERDRVINLVVVFVPGLEAAHPILKEDVSSRRRALVGEDRNVRLSRVDLLDGQNARLAVVVEGKIPTRGQAYIVNL